MHPATFSEGSLEHLLILSQMDVALGCVAVIK